MPISDAKTRAFVKMLAADPRQADSIEEYLQSLLLKTRGKILVVLVVVDL